MEPIEILPSALHALRATPTTVHWGYFDASLAPALRVKSGDLVQAEAITSHAGDDPDLMFDSAIETLFRDIPPGDRHPGPHIMTGPIFDEGVRAGDMLEVRYLSMTPRCRYGSNWQRLPHAFRRGLRNLQPHLPQLFRARQAAGAHMHRRHRACPRGSGGSRFHRAPARATSRHLNPLAAVAGPLPCGVSIQTLSWLLGAQDGHERRVGVYLWRASWY
jgi:hypothetical protein